MFARAALASGALATTRVEFAFDVVPVGQEPTLVRKSFKGAPTHLYAGGAMLAAAGVARVRRERGWLAR